MTNWKHHPIKGMGLSASGADAAKSSAPPDLKNEAKKETVPEKDVKSGKKCPFH